MLENSWTPDSDVSQQLVSYMMHTTLESPWVELSEQESDGFMSSSKASIHTAIAPPEGHGKFGMGGASPAHDHMTQDEYKPTQESFVPGTVRRPQNMAFSFGEWQLYEAALEEYRLLLAEPEGLSWHLGLLSGSQDNLTKFRPKLTKPPNLGRRMLPIIVDGGLHNALPDTGSIDNVMSEKFARSIGAVLKKRNASELYHNACGKEFVSKWTTTLPCSFPEKTESLRSCGFSVVSNLSVPLIMGSEFLRITKTLTKFKHRLIKVIDMTLTKWRLLHLQIPRRGLRCSIDGEVILANADTGSNIDLVSLRYARRRNLQIQLIDRRFREVQLADGTISRLAGKVDCRFKVGDDSADDTEIRTFYVLPDLTSEVLLGDQTLEDYDAFDMYKDEFIDTDDISNSVDLIYWIGSEGWPSLNAMIKDAKTGELEGISTIPQSTIKRWAVRVGLKTEPRIWRAADVLGHDANYQRYVDKIANWNERNKDLFERRATTLSGQRRLDAENEEMIRLQQYESKRLELEALHQARKSGTIGSA